MKRPLGRCLTSSWLIMISWVTSNGVHSFHTNYPPNPARYYPSPAPNQNTRSHQFAAPTLPIAGRKNQARRPAFVLQGSLHDSLGSMTQRAFGMFSSRVANTIKKDTSLSVSASHPLEPRPPSTPPPLDVVILQERLQDEVELLAGKVLDQIPALNNNIDTNQSKSKKEPTTVANQIGMTEDTEETSQLQSTEILNAPVSLQVSSSPSSSLPIRGELQRPSISRILGRLVGTVMDQISVVKTNLVKQIKPSRLQTNIPLQPTPPTSPPPPQPLPEEQSRISRIFSRFGGGKGGNRPQKETRRKDETQTSRAARKSPKKDGDDGDGDDDDKFSFEQRIESIKSAVVGALSGGVASTPFIYLHDVAVADGSANGIAQWEFDTDMGSLEAALFALVYRYAIREDSNPMLQQGAVGAFVLVRTLSRIHVSSGCDAIPLSCKYGRPLSLRFFGLPTHH